MSCTKIFKTQGAVPGATAVKILDHNIHRKGLMLATSGGDVKVAVGYTPAATDYFDVVAGHPVIFDELVPIGEIWASGTGTLVYGESI